MCVLNAKRELSDFFRKKFHAEAFIDMQPISSAARSDEVPSAFYFWVRVSTEDAKQYRAGTARVVLRVDSKCDGTGFISKADILASRLRVRVSQTCSLLTLSQRYCGSPRPLKNSD
jgi:hypothetical protein